MKESIVERKSKKFAIRILHLSNYLRTEKKEKVLSDQILRSGTSIGANIVEARCGCSKKDFLLKMQISFKECVETAYWLELLFEGNFINKEMFDSLYNDNLELRRLLSSITKSTSEKINK